MKTMKLFLLWLACGAMLTSCISGKKYREVISERDAWQSKYSHMNNELTNLHAQYANLMVEKGKVVALSTDELNRKEAEISEKENLIREREAKINELTKDMKAQRDAISNLKQEVCSALKCFTPAELTVEVREGKLYVSISDKLLFPSGSDVVNARGKDAIAMLAAVLANSDLEIMVEGHTDNVPITTYKYQDNWDLSVHRATSVTRILTQSGIPATRVIATGRGEYHPLASNATEEGKQLNRRTEIVLAPKLDKLWNLTEEDDNMSNARPVAR